MEGVQGVKFRKSARARHVRITITRDGACVVTVPKRLPTVFAERFVVEKQTWIIAKQQEMRRRREGSVRVDAPPFAEVKSEVLRFTTQEVARVNKEYGFSYAKITVRDQKTRWGSCSSRGTLSFNYRIMYLPPHLATYLVAHELCHLRERNHGARFWELVARVCPEYKQCRTELKNIHTMA